MKIHQLLLENNNYPFESFYCYFNGIEYLFSGFKDTNVINETISYSPLGNIIINVLENKDKLFNIINKYIEIISNYDFGNNEIKEQIVVYSKLVQFQEELSTIKYFDIINIPVQYCKKFIQQYSQYTIEKEYLKNIEENIYELKKMAPPSKSFTIDSIFEQMKLNQETKVKNIISFQDLVIRELNIFINSILLFSLNLDILLGKITLEPDNITSLKALHELNNGNNFYKCNCISKFALFYNNNLYIDDTIDKSIKIQKIPISNLKVIELYQFTNIIELLNLSLVRIIDNNITIKKCKNCENYFIPQNRTDEIYCDRISPQNSNKTCKEYGAKKTYRDEIKSTPIKYEHNKTSQFFRMRINRANTNNTKDKEMYQKKFNTYKENYQKKKEQYQSGKLKEKDFVEWIIKQKEGVKNGSTRNHKE